LLTRMTGISLHMQWPLTSQLLGNCFFPLWIKLHAHDTVCTFGHGVNFKLHIWKSVQVSK
jgi:phenolic acid decarboxylase